MVLVLDREGNYTRTSETDIENYLIRQVEKVGGKAYKGNPFGQRGFMDRICMFPGGLTVFVEVKAPGRKPRPNQREMIKQFKTMGFQAVWVDTRAKVDRLVEWAVEHRRLHRLVIKDEICIRQDCPMRRGKIGEVK